MVGHHPRKYGGPAYSGSGDIMVALFLSKSRTFHTWHRLIRGGRGFGKKVVEMWPKIELGRGGFVKVAVNTMQKKSLDVNMMQKHPWC